MKNIIIISLLLLIACQSKKEDNDSIVVTPTDSTKKVPQEIKGDSGLRLRISNDSLFFLNNDTVIYHSHFMKNKIIGGDSINPKEMRDQAYTIASCAVILRNVLSAGHFCDIPNIKKVEIITKEGKITTHSSEIEPTHMNFETSDFFGNHYSNKSDEWGVINIEAEGELYGYLIIKKDGSVKSFNIDDFPDEIWEIQTHTAKFNDKDELEYQMKLVGNVQMKLIVKKDGTRYYK